MQNSIVTEPMTCGCSADDQVNAAHERQCDYCGTQRLDAHCPHDAYQNPCPECDVVPLVQLSAVSVG